MTPFCKWAGGKRQLLPELISRMPTEYGNYYEPFVGGGALFLRIAPETAIINDCNAQLINVYVQLRENTDKVISLVNELDNVTCNQLYYNNKREQYNNKIKHGQLDAECAALFIWINKHAFNGLYRVNSKGLYNVPWNKKETGRSIDVNNLVAISRYLESSNIDIRCQDYKEVCKEPSAGDFVYFDSPYIPESKTASFTDYTKDGFTYDDHVELADTFKRLSDRGVYVMLSNNNVPLAHELYNGFIISEVDARRSINSDASKRTGKELIITNYEV